MNSRLQNKKEFSVNLVNVANTQKFVISNFSCFIWSSEFKVCKFTKRLDLCANHIFKVLKDEWYLRYWAKLIHLILTSTSTVAGVADHVREEVSSPHFMSNLIKQVVALTQYWVCSRHKVWAVVSTFCWNAVIKRTE